MEVTCPKCGGAIAQDDVNVAKDVAFCRACNEAFPLSDLVDDVEGDFADVDLNDVPAGVVVENYGSRLTIAAPTRSGWAIFWLLFVGGFGIVAPFGVIASQIKNGQFEIGLTLFAIPFMAVGVFAAYMTLLMTIGRVQITLDGDRMEVFTGFASLGFRKAANLASVTKVYLGDSGTRVNDRPVSCLWVDIENGKPLKFGTWLRDDRKTYVGAVLRQLIRERQRARL
ncbi:MAG: hypothetical protein JXL80_04085 [Planctomycetes bacterium]|nr:hypothetical protein [Planctomycetota bacterium]